MLEIEPKRDCQFCLLPQTKMTQEFSDLYLSSNENPVEEKFMQVLDGVFPISDNFYVAINILPIGDFQLLYCPQNDPKESEHPISFARLENQTEAEQGLQNILARLNDKFPTYYFLVFEHGEGDIDNSRIKCGGCSVSHAHKNIVGINEDFFKRVENMLETYLKDIGWDIDSNKRVLTQGFSMEELSEDERKHPYLDFGVYRPDRSMAHVVYLQQAGNQSPQSQIMRKIIGECFYGQWIDNEEIGRLLWNWSDTLFLCSLGDDNAEKVTYVAEDIITEFLAVMQGEEVMNTA